MVSFVDFARQPLYNLTEYNIKKPAGFHQRAIIQ